MLFLINEVVKINRMLRCWAEIDMCALSNNILEIKKICKDSKILATVKANGYGHGSIEAAKIFIENGAYGLGVHFIDEAIELREAKINSPILILGFTPCNQTKNIVKYNIIPSVFTRDFAKSLSYESVKSNIKTKVHIKIDTGMNRIGFIYNDENIERKRTIKEIVKLSKLPNIQIDGIFTHFSSSDENIKYTKRQFDFFMDLINELEKIGFDIRFKHSSNSAALINFPNMHLNMVRPGIILYGAYPSNFVNENILNLQLAMNFKTTVVHVKNVKKGEYIGYGNIYRANKNIKVATISAGYADGYLSSLSNNTKVIVRNTFANVVGRICMDQCMIDATSGHNISAGDEVLLFGRQNNLSISLNEIAKKANTIPHEIICIIGRRVPRVYVKKEKVVKVLNYLNF